MSDRTVLLSFSTMEIANSDFPLYIFDNFPAIVYSVVLISYFLFSVVARKLSMTGSIRIFEKKLHSKITYIRVPQGQTSKYDRLAHTPRTQDRCPHRVLRLSVNPHKPECYSRYSASGHLQKFAADLSLSRPQNSQPCKIFTLSVNSNQNMHTPASANFRFLS